MDLIDRYLHLNESVVSRDIVAADVSYLWGERFDSVSPRFKWYESMAGAITPLLPGLVRPVEAPTYREMDRGREPALRSLDQDAAGREESSVGGRGRKK